MLKFFVGDGFESACGEILTGETRQNRTSQDAVPDLLESELSPTQGGQIARHGTEEGVASASRIDDFT